LPTGPQPVAISSDIAIKKPRLVFIVGPARLGVLGWGFMATPERLRSGVENNSNFPNFRDFD